MSINIQHKLITFESLFNITSVLSIVQNNFLYEDVNETVMFQIHSHHNEDVQVIKRLKQL